MMGQAVENGFEAWLGPKQFLPLRHQLGVAFVNGAAGLGLEDMIHVLPHFEQVGPSLWIVAPEGGLETAMPVLQGMKDALVMDRVRENGLQGLRVILVHIGDDTCTAPQVQV